ncbi:membralin-like protein At1g60995 [Phoenix dactylifera]|uniref:Membralin-like protein At1g60995 n=1 Tax=Phoenix dactylifera TaxID=42345 RepID=A0A8B7BPF4_PHODC|nr:membralin-like protein At1g60995 [Phoenix dactylifera]
MDTEQTFLRVHARVSGMLSQLLTPRIRLALEYGYLAVAVALFCLLVVMHTNFVQQPGCSSEFSGIEFNEAQLVHIKIMSGGLWAQSAADQNIVNFQQETSTENSKIPEVNGDEFTILTAKFWSNWLGSGARRSKLIFRSWKSDKEFLEPQLENAADSSIGKAVLDETDIKVSTEGHKGLPLSARESFKAAVLHFFTKWHMRLISFWRNTKHFSQSTFQLLTTARRNESLDISKWLQALSMENLSSLIVQWLEKRSKAFEPTYLYAVEKGFFLLPEGAKSRHSIRTINITISAQNPCFGNRWQQLLINSLVGYDTILTNSLLSYPGQGYLYNFQTKEFYGLSYGHELAEGPARFGDYFVTKCGVLIMSLFVFFTTTMSVSFTLRETQSRMLKFTVQLQHHARHRLPTFQLIFVHVIESLVFVPIMIGILFFLFEFYDDQLLAFLVLTLVWLCELFTMISVRTSISMQFFPRFFLLYFLVFHIYFFSYAYGFSYLAFSATAAFMQHLILYFWNRFEVPALQRFMRNRAQMQQQAGVQITSSTIYTSTVHIARVNVRNGGGVSNELGDGPRRLHLGPDHPGSGESTQTREQSVRDTPETVNNDLHIPALSPRQTGTAPGSSLLNPFGSLLLWILGGASSDGIVSFFSTFRDVRDQGQAFAENPQNEEETVT